MAPNRAKKTASTSSYDSIPTSQAPSTVVPTKLNDETHTPEQHQTRPVAVSLTQAQKQALMDNLQLEITERARKLRAQYAEQAQALRARLELRVNRIPQGLRKRKIQDLIDEHAERARPQPAAPVPVLQDEVGQGVDQADFGGGKRTLKRNSNHLDADEDKENMASEANKDLANPKKRTKTTTTTTANTKASRTVSRKEAPSAVLSPKSHNSRTLPRSPFKTASSQQKVSTTTRPTSPTKPAPAATTTTKAPARAPTRQTRRKGVATSDQENDGRSSEGSNTSASTTIVSKIVNKAKATAAGRRAAATKTTTAAAAKRTAAVQKKENVAPASTTAGGRTLRKRG